MTLVFGNDKERIKAAVRREAESACDMIDCLDDPVALSSTTIQYGVRVTIEIEPE